MNRFFPIAAFVVGLSAIGWVASGYLGSNRLALSITLLIGFFYLVGAAELHRYRQATDGLRGALDALRQPLTALADWLATLHPALREPVRLRIEGERSGLPAPGVTPYLVGLLVLLGMLGTFLGMVVTLNGAVLALQTTTDLAAIRAALAAPIQGLGLAFGTSIAGVAASAMLGLMSALCRRERMLVAQQLDARTATVLRPFSRAHQREQTLDNLRQQAQALPGVLEHMQALMAQMERHHLDLGERLLAGQDRFHQHAQGAYTDLAASVDQSLQHSLRESARVAGMTIAPLVETTMAGITRETAVFQRTLSATVQQQLDALVSRFDASVTTVANGWTSALEQHDGRNTALAEAMQESVTALVDGVARQSASLLETVGQAHVALQTELVGGDQQRLAAWQASLDGMAASLRDEAQRTAAHALAQQERICSTLEQTARDVQTQAGAQARDTLAELARLMDAASDAPRAAAQVVDTLREALSDSLLRDNDMLQERSRIMDTVSDLLGTLNQAATEQRGAIDALVTSAATMLERTGTQFGQTIGQASETLETVSAQAAAGSIEMASMGEAFGVAVQQFGASGAALADHLQRIEAALDRSSTRSDEQLAYYVAQAREIVDLSISSQQRIVDDLQRLGVREGALAGEAGN